MDGNIFPGDLRLWLNDWRDPIQIGQIDTVCLPTTRLVWPKVPEIGESVRINRHHAHSVVYFVNFSLPLRRSGIKFHISNESLHDCVRVCHLRECFIPYLIFWLETKIPNLIISHFHNCLFVQSKICIFWFCCNHLPLWLLIMESRGAYRSSWLGDDASSTWSHTVSQWSAEHQRLGFPFKCWPKTAS